MKKEYIKPEIEVIKLDAECSILAGSDSIDKAGDGTTYSPDYDEYVD